MGRFGEAWRMVGECVGKAWNHGVAWGMLGNALMNFGWVGVICGRLGQCLGDALEAAWGGLRRFTQVVPYTLGLSLG